MIPTPEKLGLFYPSKDLPSADSALPERSVTTGSTTISILTSSINQVSGFWTGALGFFYGAGTQAALRGHMFHVQRWDKDENKLYLTSPLPLVPITTDKFVIFAGGKYTSTQEVFGLKMGGKQPEVDEVLGANITGVILTKASGMLGEGTLSVQYAAATKGISIKMDTGLYGPEVILSKDETVAVFNSDFSGYVLVKVSFSALKTTGTHTDTFVLTVPKNVLIPNYEGYETNTGKLVERYHMLVVKNKSVDPIDAMSCLSFWTEKPNYPATKRALSFSASALYGKPAAMTVLDASSWPARGFWICNTSQTPKTVAYVRYRNGNTLYLAPLSDGFFLFTNGSDALVPGTLVQSITNAPTVAAGTLRITRVEIASGSPAANTAAGICHFTCATGTDSDSGFTPGINRIYISGTEVLCGYVTATNSYSKIFRGWRPQKDISASQYSSLLASSSGLLEAAPRFTAGASDNIEVWPDFDLGVAATSGLSADPADEYTYPEGIVFQPYVLQTSPLIHDVLPGGNSLSLWIRQTIVDGTQARQNIVGNLRTMWN